MMSKAPVKNPNHQRVDSTFPEEICNVLKKKKTKTEKEYQKGIQNTNPPNLSLAPHMASLVGKKLLVQTGARHRLHSSTNFFQFLTGINQIYNLHFCIFLYNFQFCIFLFIIFFYLSFSKSFFFYFSRYDPLPTPMKINVFILLSIFSNFCVASHCAPSHCSVFALRAGIIPPTCISSFQ